jgi:hypothetical protein
MAPMMVAPVVVMVPRMVAADPARAVIGPYPTAEAARTIIIVARIIGRSIIIEARTEMMVVVMPEHHRRGEVRAAVMIEDTAVGGGHASQVDAAASEMTTTPEAVAPATPEAVAAATPEAVAAATPEAVAAASATMSAAAPVSAMDLGDQRVRGVFRDRRRSRIDRRERFRAMCGRHHQHRSGRDAKRLLETAPEIGTGYHG